MSRKVVTTENVRCNKYELTLRKKAWDKTMMASVLQEALNISVVLVIYNDGSIDVHCPFMKECEESSGVCPYKK